MKTNTTPFLILSIFTASLSSVVHGQSIPNGLYIGDEFMPEYSKATHEKWYNSNTLKITGSQAHLNTSPYSIDKNGEKLWSASDGGFLYYSGTVEKKNGDVSLEMELYRSDYAGEVYEVDKEKAKKYPGYEKMPFKEQKEKGIMIKKKVTLGGKISLQKNGFIFKGVRYKLHTPYYCDEQAVLLGSDKMQERDGKKYISKYLRVKAKNGKENTYLIPPYTRFQFLEPGSLCNVWYYFEGSEKNTATNTVKTTERLEPIIIKQ